MRRLGKLKRSLKKEKVKMTPDQVKVFVWVMLVAASIGVSIIRVVTPLSCGVLYKHKVIGPTMDIVLHSAIAGVVLLLGEPLFQRYFQNNGFIIDGFYFVFFIPIVISGLFAIIAYDCRKG